MYSLAHVHLLLNHFPLIVTILGLVLVIAALVKRSDLLARTALWFFVGGALITIPTYLTGHNAARAVFHMEGVTRDVIHAHSTSAFTSALVMYFLGLFAAWALWKYRAATLVPDGIVRSALALSFLCTLSMSFTALLGGQVRHTEVRADYVAPPEPPPPPPQQ